MSQSDSQNPEHHDSASHHANEKVQKYHAKYWDVYLLGLGMVLGGVCVNWNLGMRYGLSVFYMAWLFTAVLYFLLVMCLAELASIVAFAGGSYGYVRCGLSPFWGFLVGVSEWFQNNAHMIGTIIVIGRSLNTGLEIKSRWRPLWYFIAYIISIVFVARGGKVFWYSMTTCACVTVIIILMFIFGAIFGDSNFEDTANDRLDSYEAGFMGYEGMILRVVNYSGWMFMGCEAVSVSIAKTMNAKEVIPRSMIAVYFTTLIFTMAIILLSFFERTNLFKKYYMNRFPFEYVFHHYYGFSKDSSAFLVLIPSFSAAFGFLFASMYQTHALAMSGLLPRWLRATEGVQRVPVRALIVCALLQYIVCFISWKVRYDRTSRVFFTLSMTGASFAYVGIFATYIAFKRRFPSLPRGFVSPLGEVGAFLGILCATINFVCGVGFQEFSVLASVYGFAIFVAVIWYKYVAEKSQFFSPEEQQKFLRAYVVKLNNARLANQQQQAQRRVSFYQQPQTRVSISNSGTTVNIELPSVKTLPPMATVMTENQSPYISGRRASSSEGRMRIVAQLEHVVMVILGVRSVTCYSSTAIYPQSEDSSEAFQSSDNFTYIPDEEAIEENVPIDSKLKYKSSLESLSFPLPGVVEPTTLERKTGEELMEPGGNHNPEHHQERLMGLTRPEAELIIDRSADTIAISEHKLFQALVGEAPASDVDIESFSIIRAERSKAIMESMYRVANECGH